MRAGLAFTSLLLLVGCQRDRDLRGPETLSADGKTYLSIDDDCFDGATYKLDGKPWGFALKVPGLVEAGHHVLNCSNGGDYSFSVHEGRVFHFNYWGP